MKNANHNLYGSIIAALKLIPAFFGGFANLLPFVITLFKDIV